MISKEEDFGGFYDGGTATEEKTDAEKTDAHVDTTEKDKALMYPDDNKTDEEKAAETKAAEDKAAADKLAEGKTEEELAAEKKAADEKAAEGKTEEEKAAEAKAEEEKKAEAEKAKDAGLVTAEDLQFPEGIKVDEGIKDELVTLVNDKDMKPSEKAQALIGLQQKLYTAQVEAHQEQVVTWEAEVAKDKEFIGETGDQLDANLAIAKKGFEALKIEGLMPWLRDTGNGSNPMFVRIGLRIGNSIGEDSFRTGGLGGKTGPKDTKELFYGAPKKV